MRNRLIWLLAVMALVIAACSESTGTGTAAPEPTAPAPSGPGDAASGQPLFDMTCAACHGSMGEGVAGLGKPFQGSDFLGDRSDEEMVAFLQVGRPADDPANTTGIAMLPRGGNSNLTDQDLLDIVAFLRTLSG